MDNISQSSASQESVHAINVDEGLTLREKLRRKEVAEQRRKHQQQQRQLQHYTQQRRNALYKQNLQKIAFSSPEYCNHPVLPGIDVFRVLGEQFLRPNIQNSSREVTTILPLKANIPPTLLMFPDLNYVFYSTNKNGFVCRTDNSSLKHFKHLLRREKQEADASRRITVDPTVGKRKYSSVQGDGCARIGGTGWQPSASDDNPWLQMEFRKTTVLGIALQSYSNTAFVTSLSISHSFDGISWYKVDNGIEFVGLSADELEAEVFFTTPLHTQFLRIYPKCWEGSRPGCRAGVVIEAEEKKEKKKLVLPVAVLKKSIPGSNTTNCQTLYVSQLAKACTPSAVEPQVLQEYVCSRGAFSTLYRCVWKQHSESYAYVISNRVSTTSDTLQSTTSRFLASQAADDPLNIFLIRRGACQQICTTSEHVAKLLHPILKSAGTIDTLVTDWIRDSNDVFWLVNVKGWRLRNNVQPPLNSTSETERSQKVKQVKKLRKCGVCQRRVELEARLTIAMILKTVNLLRARGVWNGKHCLPKGTGSSKYQYLSVCVECYQMYRSETRSDKADRELASQLGVSLSAVDAATVHEANCYTKLLTKPSSEGFSAAIKAASLGREQTRDTTVNQQQWQLLLYFEKVYNLPDHLPLHSLSLRVKSLLGNTDILPFPRTRDKHGGTVSFHLLKVRCFYTDSQVIQKATLEGEEPQTAGVNQYGLKVLDENVQRFLKVQKCVNVDLCCDEEVIGTAAFPLRQLNSGMLSKLQLLRMFSTASLGTCSLRIKIGLVNSSLSLTKGEEVARHPSGLFVPRAPSYNINALPTEWRVLVADGNTPEPEREVSPPEKEGEEPPKSRILEKMFAFCKRDDERERNRKHPQNKLHTTAHHTVKNEEEYLFFVRNLKGLKQEKANAKNLLETLEFEPPKGKCEQLEKETREFRKQLKTSKKKRPIPQPPQPPPPPPPPVHTSPPSSFRNTTSASLMERLLRIREPSHSMLSFDTINTNNDTQETALTTFSDTPNRTQAWGDPSENSGTKLICSRSPPIGGKPRSVKHAVTVAPQTGGRAQCVKVIESRNEVELGLPLRFTAWKFEVSLKTVEGLLPGEEGGDVNAAATWTATYSLFGERMVHRGFRLVASGPLQLQADSTTYLFCHSNKSLVKYLREGVSRLKIYIHNTYECATDAPQKEDDMQEMRNAVVAELNLAPIAEDIIAKRNLSEIEGLLPLKRPSGGGGLLTSLHADNLSDSDDDEMYQRVLDDVEDEENENDDDDAETIFLGGGGKGRLRRVRQGQGQEEEEDEDSDDFCVRSSHPLLEFSIRASATDLSVAEVKILRDLRPEYDIAVVDCDEDKQ